jgi:hypothetical protein
VTNVLFDRLVEASGLSAVIGPGVLDRLFRKERVAVSTLRRSDIFHCRDAIMDTLRTYLTDVELAEAMRRIENLCRTNTVPMKLP